MSKFTPKLKESERGQKVCRECLQSKPDTDRYFGVRMVLAGSRDKNIEHYTRAGSPMKRETLSVCKECANAKRSATMKALHAERLRIDEEAHADLFHRIRNASTNQN